MNLELRQIAHALALAKFRHYARAAEALRLTQPSLSRSIASLEDALGVRLFDRGRNGVEPTAFGRILLERGAELVRAECELRREIALTAGLDAGTLTIAAGPYASEVSVARAVAAVVAAHPRLRIQLRTVDPVDVIAEVVSRRVDLGVVQLPSRHELTAQLSFEPLQPHSVFLACRPGHPLLKVREVSLERALKYPLVSIRLVGVQAMSALAGGAMGAYDADAATFLPAIQVTSLALARQIAQESDALFPGTASMLADDVDRGRLALLGPRLPKMVTTCGLLTLRERTLSPSAQVFIRVLRDVDAELAATVPHDWPVETAARASRAARSKGSPAPAQRSARAG
jgi:DNA-binding transcriptional LysR family regulator